MWALIPNRAFSTTDDPGSSAASCAAVHAGDVWSGSNDAKYRVANRPDRWNIQRGSRNVWTFS